MSETAERLMDLAEAHIRTPDTGASASATLRPRSASRARACIIISHQGHDDCCCRPALRRPFPCRVARRPNESAGDAFSVYRLAFRKTLSRPRLTSGIGTSRNCYLPPAPAAYASKAASDEPSVQQ